MYVCKGGGVKGVHPFWCPNCLGRCEGVGWCEGGGGAPIGPERGPQALLPPLPPMNAIFGVLSNLLSKV